MPLNLDIDIIIIIDWGLFMVGSSIPYTQKMEQFQTAYIHAIASIYGWRVDVVKPDYDGVDIGISGTCQNKQVLIHNPRIDVQLKGNPPIFNGRFQ